MGWWGGGGKYQQKKDVEIIYNSSNSHCFMSVCFSLFSGCFWQNIKHQFFVTLNVFFIGSICTIIYYRILPGDAEFISFRKAVFTHTNWLGELDGFYLAPARLRCDQSIILDDFR